MVLLQFWFLIIRFGTSIWDSEIRYEVDEIANDLRTITFLIRFFSIRIPRRMIFEVHEIANDLRTITFLIRFFSIRIPRCMIFAKCLHDASWILIFFFFSNFSVVRICLVFSIRVPRSMIFPKCLHDASWILIFFVSNFLYCKFVQYSSRFMYLY